MKWVLGCLLAAGMVVSGSAHAWSDRTFLDDGTPLREKPSARARVIALIPDGQVVKGASSSIDRDCSHEAGFDLFCKVTWRGKAGYVLMEDLLELGDDFDDF
jgi:hypothetical protein